MELPARIGKYELEEYLGGGMSQVYRARDTIIGRTVAVKILTEKGRDDVEAKARFLAEARTAGNISHENILGIYDFGEDEQHRPFLVMEFLRGEDLRHAIRGGRTGDLRNKLRIALQIARALEYIHAQKIIHRDLKPENVHITPAGQVKLMDFGISKREGLELTRTGFIVGTPYYMAPEQVTGASVTTQADVYAFGILLYELATGKHPVVGESMERLFYAILNEPLDLAPMRECRLPEEVCQLVDRCTAKNPAERPQGFVAVCAELERLIAGQEPVLLPLDAATIVMPERQIGATPLPTEKPPAPAPPESRRTNWLLPVAGVAIIAIAAGAFFVLRPHTPAASTTSAGTASTSAAPAVSAPAVPAGMVLVPAGNFQFGAKNEPATLPAFYIDRTEVTNAAYADFCRATSHALPSDFPANKPDYPVVNVSFEDAKSYAMWAGKRLPTAQEWEKAARGPDGRVFPWGNNDEPMRANVGTQKLRPATDFQQGASPYHTLQMVGNVWELVEQPVTPSPGALDYFRARLTPAPAKTELWVQTRGEAFDYAKLDDHAITDFASAPARWHAANLGFRCVKDAP